MWVKETAVMEPSAAWCPQAQLGNENLNWDALANGQARIFSVIVSLSRTIRALFHRGESDYK